MPKKGEKSVVSGWTIAQVYHHYVGKYAWWKCRSKSHHQGSIYLNVPVKILNARLPYGLPTLLVQPLNGQGTMWIGAAVVEVIGSKQEILELSDVEITDATHGIAVPFRSSSPNADQQIRPEDLRSKD